MTLKFKFEMSFVFLDVSNNTPKTVTPSTAIGIVDFRYMGYYKIKQGVLQQRKINLL